MTAAAEATAPATEAAATTAQPEGLTTASSPWAMKAEALPNKDLHVQTTDPIFEGQTKRITFLAPQPEDDDGNESVRISFRIEDEIVTTDGDKKAPGHVVSPFPRRLRVKADASAKEHEKLQRDLRGLGLDLQAIGLLPRRKDPTLGQIYRALGELEGKQALAKFSTTKGSKRNEDGEFPTFQNIRFAPVGGAGEANGAAATSAASNGGDY